MTPMKLKRSSVEAVEEAKPAAAGGAFISARLRNPADELAAQGSEAGDKIGGICAIIATVLLAIITFMLFSNWNLIKSA